MPHPIHALRRLALVTLLATLAAAGCHCGGNAGTNTAGNGATPGTPWRTQLVTALADYANPAAGATTARADAFFRENAARAVPVLIDWLGSDPWLTAGLRAAMSLPANAGGAATLELGMELSAPETLDAIAEIVLGTPDDPGDTTLRDAAIEHIVGWHEAGMDALRRAAGNDRRQQRNADAVLRRFAKIVQLRYWCRLLVSDQQQERDAAAKWLRALVPAADRLQRDMTLELFHWFREYAPQTIRAADEFGLRQIKAQRAIFERLLLYRPMAGDDAWYVPAFAHAVVHLQDFQDIQNTITTHLTNIRREGFMHRLKQWLAATAPADLDDSVPEWIGLKTLGFIIKQAETVFDRGFRPAKNMRPDVVRSPSGEEVPYPPDATAETLTDSQGNEFAVAAKPPVQPPPPPPGLPATNDADIRAQLMSLPGASAAEWSPALRLVVAAGSFADSPADIEQQYPAERWLGLAGLAVSVSPLTRALAACGDAAVEPLVAALGAGDAKADWRRRCGAMMALAMLGRLARVRALLAPPGDGPQLRGHMEWLTFCTAMLLDSATLTDPTLLSRAPADGNADAALCRLLAAPPALVAPAVPPARAPSIRFAGTKAADWLMPAFGAGLARQTVVAQPAFQDAGDGAWLRAGTADPLSAVQAALLDALMLQLDVHTDALGGSSRLHRLIDSLSPARRTAVVDRICWGRHQWALPGIMELLDRNAESPSIGMLDALSAYGPATALPVLARYVTHADPAVRLRAVRALPAEGEWLAPLRKALDDTDPKIAVIAATKLLVVPDAQAAAAEKLWQLEAGQLLVRLHLLPTADALAWLDKAVKDPDRLHDVARGVDAWSRWLQDNRATQAATGRRFVELLGPAIVDPRWGNATERAHLIRVAHPVDREALTPFVRTACRDAADVVVAAALEALLDGDSLTDADVPGIVSVLTRHDLPRRFQQVCAWLSDARHRNEMKRKPLVDALLPWLAELQPDNLQLAAGLALVSYFGAEADPRIGPAIRAARDAGVIDELSSEFLRFLSVNPDETTLRWMMHLLVIGSDDEAYVTALMLRELYYMDARVRPMLRQEIWPAGKMPESFDAITRVAMVVAWPRGVVDATWMDALLTYDASKVPGAPQLPDAEKLPLTVVEVMYTLVSHHGGLPVPTFPDSGRERAVKEWLATNFSTLKQWKAWWAKEGPRVIREANAEYETRLKAGG
ncbi:MAG: HEAT repeat domain-containing protein [Planctomycetota bacterium]